jgi:hypothetical protein
VRSGWARASDAGIRDDSLPQTPLGRYALFSRFCRVPASFDQQLSRRRESEEINLGSHGKDEKGSSPARGVIVHAHMHVDDGPMFSERLDIHSSMKLLVEQDKSALIDGDPWMILFILVLAARIL